MMYNNMVKKNNKDIKPGNVGSQVAKTVRGQTLGNQDIKKLNTKKKKAPKKKYLKTPFQHEWPAVSTQVCENIITLLRDTFTNEGLQRELCTRGGKKAKEKSGGTITETNISHNPTWKCLVFGVNAVTRCMEKGEASLLLCDRDVYPSQLTSHLLELSVHNNVPAASIAGLSTIGEIVGLRSITCLAFKLLSNIENESLSSMISSIITIVPKLKSPIVQQKAPELDLSQVSDTSTNKEEEMPLQSQATKSVPHLPDDIDFASLYVYKKDLQFNKQEDFISLSTSLKRRTHSTQVTLPTKKLRYMSAEIGQVKYNPDRTKIERAKKKPRQ